MKRLLTSAAFLLATVAPSLSFAQVVPGDYDGDNLSDLNAVFVIRKGVPPTQWVYERSSDKQLTLLTFNQPGDALVAGRFYKGDKKTYPGIVYVSDAKLPLNWYIKNPQGTDTFLNFGLPGDTIPNLGDVDCDGITDVIVVRNFPDGFRRWYIAQTKNAAIGEYLFGMNSDKVYVADVDGDNCAELVALRPNEYNWYSRKISGDAIGVVQWGLPGDIPLLPQDINGDGKPDYIISRITGGTQTAYVRTSSSSYTTMPLGLSTSIPAAGKFANGARFAWFQRDAGLVGLGDGAKPEIRVFGTTQNAIVRPDGTVIQPYENGVVGSTSSGGGPGPVGSCSAPKFPDGDGKALWKPYRDGGGGSGDATFLIPGSSGGLSTSVILYGSNGQEVHRMKLRYHYGPGNRSVWDATVSNTTLKPSAPLTLRTTYGNGACEDRLVPDPTKRYD